MDGGNVQKEEEKNSTGWSICENAEKGEVEMESIGVVTC